MITPAVVFLSVIVLVMAAPASEGEQPQDEMIASDNPDGSSHFHMEAPCARVGGACMKAEDCPSPDLILAKGLCPMQRAAGVECCNGKSIRERRCVKRGGQCLPKIRCGRQLWDEHAEDCGKDEACCILVY